jgi:hypothetical protein
LILLRSNSSSLTVRRGSSPIFAGVKLKSSEIQQGLKFLFGVESPAFPNQLRVLNAIGSGSHRNECSHSPQGDIPVCESSGYFLSQIARML